MQVIRERLGIFFKLFWSIAILKTGVWWETNIFPLFFPYFLNGLIRGGGNEKREHASLSITKIIEMEEFVPAPPKFLFTF